MTEFDGVPAQLRGNRLEMSPQHLASTGWVYAPVKGWEASTQIQFVGSRYLNKRNTALAPQYTTWSAGLGYRTEGWELRLDGVNLNDQRPPVAESEVGDAQYYRLFARRVDLRFIWHIPSGRPTGA
jgi:outer membrane receptor protein involved in Fe transport